MLLSIIKTGSTITMNGDTGFVELMNETSLSI